MDEFDKLLTDDAPIKVLRASNRPLMIPSKLITMKGLSKHLLGVYISLLYMFEKGIEDIRLVGMEEKRFETNLEELKELGLIEQEPDGTLKLLEVC